MIKILRGNIISKLSILAKIKECSLPIYLKKFSGFKGLRGKDQIKDMKES